MLTVRFLEQTHHVPETDTLVFGRGAALDVDQNPLLHRTTGRFEHRGGTWWLQNTGTRIELLVTATGGRWACRVPPGTETALSDPPCTVTFNAGAAHYRLAVECPTPTRVLHTVVGVGDATLQPEQVPLGPDHRALLAALAHRRLTGDDRDRDLSTNQEVADLLGWTLKKVNRKIDLLCDRYAAAGVPGLRGEGTRANERRRHLVDHLLRTGELTVADLAELRRAAAVSRRGADTADTADTPGTADTADGPA